MADIIAGLVANFQRQKKGAAVAKSLLRARKLHRLSLAQLQSFLADIRSDVSSAFDSTLKKSAGRPSRACYIHKKTAVSSDSDGYKSSDEGEAASRKRGKEGQQLKVSTPSDHSSDDHADEDCTNSERSLTHLPTLAEVDEQVSASVGQGWRRHRAQLDRHAPTYVGKRRSGRVSGKKRGVQRHDSRSKQSFPLVASMEVKSFSTMQPQSSDKSLTATSARIEQRMESNRNEGHDKAISRTEQSPVGEEKTGQANEPRARMHELSPSPSPAVHLSPTSEQHRVQKSNTKSGSNTHLASITKGVGQVAVDTLVKATSAIQLEAMAAVEQAAPLLKKAKTERKERKKKSGGKVNKKESGDANVTKKLDDRFSAVGGSQRSEMREALSKTRKGEDKKAAQIKASLSPIPSFSRVQARDASMSPTKWGGSPTAGEGSAERGMLKARQGRDNDKQRESSSTPQQELNKGNIMRDFEAKCKAILRTSGPGAKRQRTENDCSDLVSWLRHIPFFRGLRGSALPHILAKYASYRSITSGEKIIDKALLAADIAGGDHRLGAALEKPPRDAHNRPLPHPLMDSIVIVVEGSFSGVPKPDAGGIDAREREYLKGGVLGEAFLLRSLEHVDTTDPAALARKLESEVGEGSNGSSHEEGGRKPGMTLSAGLIGAVGDSSAKLGEEVKSQRHILHTARAGMAGAEVLVIPILTIIRSLLVAHEKRVHRITHAVQTCLQGLGKLDTTRMMLLAHSAETFDLQKGDRLEGLGSMLDSFVLVTAGTVVISKGDVENARESVLADLAQFFADDDDEQMQKKKREEEMEEEEIKREMEASIQNDIAEYFHERRKGMKTAVRPSPSEGHADHGGESEREGDFGPSSLIPKQSVHHQPEQALSTFKKSEKKPDKKQRGQNRRDDLRTLANGKEWQAPPGSEKGPESFFPLIRINSAGIDDIDQQLGGAVQGRQTIGSTTLSLPKVVSSHGGRRHSRLSVLSQYSRLSALGGHMTGRDGNEEGEGVMGVVSVADAVASFGAHLFCFNEKDFKVMSKTNKKGGEDKLKQRGQAASMRLSSMRQSRASHNADHFLAGLSEVSDTTDSGEDSDIEGDGDGDGKKKAEEVGKRLSFSSVSSDGDASHSRRKRGANKRSGKWSKSGSRRHMRPTMSFRKKGEKGGKSAVPASATEVDSSNETVGAGGHGKLEVGSQEKGGKRESSQSSMEDEGSKRSRRNSRAHTSRNDHSTSSRDHPVDHAARREKLYSLMEERVDASLRDGFGIRALTDATVSVIPLRVFLSVSPKEVLLQLSRHGEREREGLMAKIKQFKQQKSGKRRSNAMMDGEGGANVLELTGTDVTRRPSFVSQSADLPQVSMATGFQMNRRPSQAVSFMEHAGVEAAMREMENGKSTKVRTEGDGGVGGGEEGEREGRAWRRHKRMSVSGHPDRHGLSVSSFPAARAEQDEGREGAPSWVHSRVPVFRGRVFPLGMSRRSEKRIRLHQASEAHLRKALGRRGFREYKRQKELRRGAVSAMTIREEGGEVDELGRPKSREATPLLTKLGNIPLEGEQMIAEIEKLAGSAEEIDELYHQLKASEKQRYE